MPREPMTIPKKTERHLAVVDPPETNPIPQPSVMTEQLVAATHRLGKSTGALKLVLRPIRADLAQEIARLELLRTQQAPGWESKQLLGICDRGVAAVVQFIETLTTARALLAECGPLLEGAEQHAQHRRETASMALDIDILETYTDSLTKTKRGWRDLNQVVTESSTWEPIARVAVGRLFRATASVVREADLVRITAELERVRARTAEIRTTPSPVDGDLTRLQALVEHLVGSPLPVPKLTWPASTDPFSPPALQ
jgi:hypothetical protein